MGLEEQLSQAYQRAGQPEPDEAGAYDRFLRHRARQRRRVRVAISVGLALLLGLVVLTPRLLAGSQGAAGEAQRLLSRPMQGYQLPIPAGWEVANDYGDLIDLLPRRGQGRREGAQIDLQVTFVAPQQYPGGPPLGLPARALRCAGTSRRSAATTCPAGHIPPAGVPTDAPGSGWRCRPSMVAITRTTPLPGPTDARPAAPARGT